MTDQILRYSLGYSTPIPISLVLLVCLLVVYLIVRMYRNERGESRRGVRWTLSILRSLVVIAVILSALNWHLTTKKFRKPTLIILVDTSASLQHLDNNDNQDEILASIQSIGETLPTRLNILKSCWKQNVHVLDQIQENYELILIPFSGEIESTWQGTPEEFIDQVVADGYLSNIDRSLRTVIRDHRGNLPAGIILVSDGIASDDPKFVRSRSIAESSNVPVFVVGLGDKKPAIDLKIEEVRVTDRAFLNDVVEFQILISANGLAGEKTRVRLVDEQSSITLLEREIEFKGDRHLEPVRMRTRVTLPGERNFRIAASKVNGELDESNNLGTARVFVEDEQIKVLLVYDYPSREFHFLKQFLGRESAALEGQAPEFANNRIQLDTYLQQADLDYAENDRNAIKLFPVSKQQLFQYDVIILGDVKPNWAGEVAGGLGVRELENVKEFVEERGGSLILIAGPQYMPNAYFDSPLKNLFPLKGLEWTTPAAENGTLSQPSPIRRTPIGRKTLAMDISDTTEQPKNFTDFPGAFWFATSAEKKPSARVLAEFTQTGLPAVVLQNYGMGTVLYQAFPETYRWRYRSDETYFGRYWSQMIQFLSSGKLNADSDGFSLATDRKKYYRNETVTLIASVYNRKKLKPGQPLTVTVKSITGKLQRVRLNPDQYHSNQYSGEVDNLSPGHYVAEIAGSSKSRTGFSIEGFSRENERKPMNESNLQLLAKDTGGEYIGVQEFDDLRRVLPTSELIEIGQEPPWVLWRQWPFTAIFGGAILFLLTLEWIIRKRSGMV